MYEHINIPEKELVLDILKMHPVVKETSNQLEKDPEVSLELLQLYRVELQPSDAILIIRDEDQTEAGRGHRDATISGKVHQMKQIFPANSQPTIAFMDQALSGTQLEKVDVTVNGAISDAIEIQNSDSRRMYPVTDSVFTFNASSDKTTKFKNQALVLENLDFLEKITWWKFPKSEIPRIKKLADSINNIRHQLEEHFGVEFLKTVQAHFTFVTPGNDWHFYMPEVLVKNDPTELIELRQNKLLDLAENGDTEARTLLVKDSILDIQQLAFGSIPELMGITWYKPERTWNPDLPESRISTQDFGTLDGTKAFDVLLVTEKGDKIGIGEFSPGNGYYDLHFADDFIKFEASITPLVFDDTMKIALVERQG